MMTRPAALRVIASLALILLARLPLAAQEPIGLTRLGGSGLRLTLPPELGDSWRAVNVGRLQVRTAAGLRSLERGPMPAGRDLELTLTVPGCSLLQADLGPGAARGRPDAWQRVSRCAKIVFCRETGDRARDRAARLDAGSLLTAKTGSRIEIRPLFNPLQLVAGSDLPIRLYYGGEAVAGGEVTARGAGGDEIRAASDRVGIATLTIPATGAWRLRFRHRDSIAELIFDVPGD